MTEQRSTSFVRWRATVLAYAAVLAHPVTLLVVLLAHAVERLLFGSAPKSIANEVAVVTGGAQGLGQAIALELASQGCHIAVADINGELAEETAALIRQRHKVKAAAYKIDVSDYEQVVALRTAVEADLGAASVLVNNAAVLMLANPNRPAWQDVQRMINVNLTAHFWTNMVFLPKMKEMRRGHFIAISSASSFFPLIYNSEYTSTKFAVRGLMRVLRQELKAGRYDDIHTTTVFPSFLGTNAEVARIIRKTGSDAVYPLIVGAVAAEQIVAAVLRNAEEVVLPGFMGVLYRCFETFPPVWQDRIMLGPTRLFKRFQRKSAR